MTETTIVLDVRTLAPPRRHAEIFRTFGALMPGEAFVLVNDHEPKPLLYQFQAEFSGRFDWSVLETGPERFRVEIRRRAKEGSRGVAEFLQGDHRRLDAILADVEKNAGAKAYAGAGARFGEFACGLNRHIDMEEKVLFPAFEKATGMAGGGPTAVMRSEHVEIRRILERIASTLRGEDAGGYSAAVRSLHSVLGDHNMKEEQILYPESDMIAGGERERDDLVKRMQAL